MQNNSVLGMSPQISIRPWAEEDLHLLRCMNTEDMWAHLGGPETAEGVSVRHQRYLHDSKVHMFVIMCATQSVGSVGYGEK